MIARPLCSRTIDAATSTFQPQILRTMRGGIRWSSNLHDAEFETPFAKEDPVERSCCLGQ